MGHLSLGTVASLQGSTGSATRWARSRSDATDSRRANGRGVCTHINRGLPVRQRFSHRGLCTAGTACLSMPQPFDKWTIILYVYAAKLELKLEIILSGFKSTHQAMFVFF